MSHCFRLASVFLLMSGTLALTQSPKPTALSPQDLNRLAVETLKDIHNRGADLYNAADASAAFHLYDGALRTVSPFLAHSPKLQKQIADGLATAVRGESTKAKAFRLHELIEAVRTELRAELDKDDAAQALEPKTGELSGVLTLDDKPLSALILLVSLDLPKAKVFSAQSGPDGRYTMAEALPVGRYALMLSGAGVPARYTSTQTSGLESAVKSGLQTEVVKLKSK